MTTPDPTAMRLAAYDAAVHNAVVAASMAALDKHFHAEHDDENSVEECCIAVILNSARFVDTFEAAEAGRSAGAAAERERIRQYFAGLPSDNTGRPRWALRHLDLLDDPGSHEDTPE